MIILPPHHSAARNKSLIEAATSPDAILEWATLVVKHGDHSATFAVLSDALRVPASMAIDRTTANAILTQGKPTSASLNAQLKTFLVSGQESGFITSKALRINVSAAVLQRIADLLGLSLLTPKLADQTWLSAALTLNPSPQPITSETWAMFDHSARVDEQIAKKGGLPVVGGIVSDVGKDWVIAKGLGTHKGKAENYGWHFRGKDFGGQSFGAAVTPPLRLIQDQGWAHDASHSDYSQIARMIKKQVVVDGQPTTLQAVLTSPELAPLASHEGALPVELQRQPGVPLPSASGGDGSTIAGEFGAEPRAWPAMWREAPLGIGMGLGGMIGLVYGGPAGALVGGVIGLVWDFWRKDEGPFKGGK